MCGRFTLVSPEAVVTERFHAAAPAELKPRYNVAPGQEILCVIPDGPNRLEPIRWGLIPPWAKDPAIGNRLINARAETLAEKPSFRNAFIRRRCLIVADGFYEWRRSGTRRIPVYIFLKSRQPFGIAGLYELWKAPDGRVVRTCAIVTTEANELVRPLHNRMPAILAPDAEALWIDSAEVIRGRFQPLLRPYRTDEMDAYEVTPVVNNADHDAPDCILPITR